MDGENYRLFNKSIFKNLVLIQLIKYSCVFKIFGYDKMSFYIFGFFITQDELLTEKKQLVAYIFLLLKVFCSRIGSGTFQVIYLLQTTYIYHTCTLAFADTTFSVNHSTFFEIQLSLNNVFQGNNVNNSCNISTGNK